MKRAAYVVAFVKEHGYRGKARVDAVDDVLRERAVALKGNPAEKLEWLLAWAISAAHDAMHALVTAIEVDAQRGEALASAVFDRRPIESTRGLAQFRQSRVDIGAIRLEESDATLRRILEVYEALAVDPPGAE